MKMEAAASSACKSHLLV